jgi:RNA-directed DNA polymerase
MRAWFQVHRNQGAAGIDRITVEQVKEYGVTRLLDELAAELREGRYRRLPARRVLIEEARNRRAASSIYTCSS